MFFHFFLDKKVEQKVKAVMPELKMNSVPLKCLNSPPG